MKNVKDNVKLFTDIWLYLDKILPKYLPKKHVIDFDIAITKKETKHIFVSVVHSYKKDIDQLWPSGQLKDYTVEICFQKV